MDRHTRQLESTNDAVVRRWNGELHNIAVLSTRLKWHDDRACEADEIEATARLFAASPDLKDAVKELCRVIRLAGVNNLANGVQLGQISWLVKMSDALEMADRALAKAKAS